MIIESVRLLKKTGGKCTTLGGGGEKTVCPLATRKISPQIFVCGFLPRRLKGLGSWEPRNGG